MDERERIMGMTTEEMRLAIAKAKGWRCQEHNYGIDMANGPRNFYAIHGPSGRKNIITNLLHSEEDVWHEAFTIRGIPDWPNDIAASLGLISEYTDYTIEKSGLNYTVCLSAVADWTATDTNLAMAASRAWLLARAEQV
jgi:hypothetical protein